MRDKDLTAAVRPLEDRLVLLVRAVSAEHDEGEALRRGELPVGIALDPAGKELREPDVLALDRAQPFRPVAAQNRPELQRTEAAAERGAVLGERIRILRRPEIFRDERKRLAELVRS